MKFLLDENADRRLAPYLHDLGHDVTIVGEDYPASITDQEVLAIATTEQRILITNDRADFGELIFRSHHAHAGVILFRFKQEEANIALKKDRLSVVLTKYRHQLQQFIVLTPQQIRVRKTETQQQPGVLLPRVVNQLLVRRDTISLKPNVSRMKDHYRTESRAL